MTAPTTAVDNLHEEFAALLAFLDEAKEPSLRSVADNNFRKALLLAAASYFEHRLTQCVMDFVDDATSRDHVIKWLVKRKAVERQYHTWFDWDARNANRFFSLFGAALSEHVKAIVRERDDLSSAIHAFLEIGSERNRLVHQDFGSFVLEKTSQEIYDTYRSATAFVEWFPQELREFSGVPATDARD